MASTMPIEDSLQTLLNCNLCKKETDDLKALPCQHTACLPCVRQLKVVRRRFTCDICQKEYPIPNGGIENLPDSLVSKQLKDMIRKKTCQDEESSVQKSPEGTDCKATSAEEPEDVSPLGDTEVKKSDIKPSNKVSLMLADGGFGRIPSGKATTDHGVTLRKEKTQRKPATSVEAACTSPDASEVKKFKEAIVEVADSAKEWLAKTIEMMRTCRETLKVLPRKGRQTKSMFLDQQKKMKRQCQEKLKGLDKALSDRMEESKSTLEIVEPCADHMKNVLDSLPNVKLPYDNWRREPIKPEIISKAQDNLEKFEALNAAADSYPIDLDKYEYGLTSGDSVRLITIKETEEKTEGYLFCRERVSIQERLENLVYNKATHSSIGRYRGCEYEGGVLHHQVIFPEQFDWQGPAGSLVKCQQKVNLPYEGDKVKVKSTVSKPHFGWDGLRHKRSCGVLRSIQSGETENDLEVIVNFPENSSWKGLYSEIELGPSCGMEAGDEVWVSRSIPEPSRGWAGVNGSSIGKVKSVEGAEGQEEVTVDFPECKDWVGLATELELVRDPKKGEKVQVKLSVSEPRLGWGGSSHDDVGELEEIIKQYQAYGRIGNVKFPGKPEHPFLLDEIEPVRYRAPSYEEQSPVHWFLYQHMIRQEQQRREQIFRNLFGWQFHQNYYDDDDYYY